MKLSKLEDLCEFLNVDFREFTQEEMSDLLSLSAREAESKIRTKTAFIRNVISKKIKAIHNSRLSDLAHPEFVYINNKGDSGDRLRLYQMQHEALVKLAKDKAHLEELVLELGKMLREALKSGWITIGVMNDFIESMPDTLAEKTGAKLAKNH